jgi:hypothetical protein
VRLCDVDRAGTSELVSWGVGRLTDGRVELKAVGRRLVPGRRLRVAFARSYWPLVWPERDLAPVDIDDVTLVLPQWNGAAAPEFDAAESAPPGAMTVLTEGSARRVVATGRLERTTDSGRIRHSNGIVVRFVAEDRLALDCSDAETATATCVREARLEGEAWHVAIRVDARMAAARDNFAVDVALAVADERGAYPARNWRMLKPRPPE